MSFSDLAEILNKRYDTQITRHVALTGSEYIYCKGLKFRFSDHDSKNEIIDHIDVVNYEEILSILIDRKIISEKPMTREEFISIYENGGNYNGIVLTEKIVKLVDGTLIKVLNNSYADFVDVKSAANNLYSELLK